MDSLMSAKRFAQVLVFLSAGFASAATLAGNGGAVLVGEVTHSPALAVPVLGGVGLLALAALLGLFGYRVLRRDHGAGTKWLLVACVTTALASGGSGIKLINDAYAPPPMVQFLNAQGATIPFFEEDVNTNNGGACSFNAGGSRFVTVVNRTVRTQFLTDVTIADDGPCKRIEGNGGNGGVPPDECVDTPPLEMSPDDSCEIALCCWLSPG
jgi:hypothetical protein